MSSDDIRETGEAELDKLDEAIDAAIGTGTAEAVAEEEAPTEVAPESEEEETDGTVSPEAVEVEEEEIEAYEEFLSPTLPDPVQVSVEEREADSFTIPAPDPVSAEDLDQADVILEEFGISRRARDMTPEEAVEKAERLQETRVRAAQLLSRGPTLDALDHVIGSLPSDREGQLVRDRELDIRRYEALGYRVEYREDGDGKSSPHDPGDNRIRIADQILMSIDRDEYAVIVSVRQEQSRKRLGLGKRQFASDSKGHGVPIFGDTTPPEPRTAEKE